MTPSPGQIYKARGYDFKIESVQDGKVYFWRAKEGEPVSIWLVRHVPLKEWETEMEGVEPCQRQKSTPEPRQPTR